MTLPDPTRPLGPRDRGAPDRTRRLEREPAPAREGTQVLRPEHDRRHSSYTEEPASTVLEPNYRDEYGGEAVPAAPGPAPVRRVPDEEPRPRRRYPLGIVAAWMVVGLLVGAIGALLLLPEEQQPLDAELAAAAQEIDAREQDIAAREQDIAELDGQVAGLQAQIADRDAQIAQLQAQQAEDGVAADAAQAEREQALNEREAALDAREQELDGREAEIAAREQVVAEAEQPGDQQGGLDLPDLSLPSELPNVDLPSADEARGAFERFIDRVRDLFRLG